jgi:hypothetical protein
VTNPCRRPCASFPRREVFDLRGSGPRESCSCFQPAAASHTTNAHAHTYIYTHRTLGPIIIAHHQSVRFLSFHAHPPALLPLPSYLAARTAFSFLLRQGSYPFPGRPFFSSFCFALRQPIFLSACSALRHAPYPPARKNTLAQPRHARPQTKTSKQSKSTLAQRSLARIPMIDGRTKRRAVRRHG